MEAPAPTEACEIERLPADLISAVLSRTAPRDTCRAAAVSPAFRAVADSDSVWASFLPHELPPLADGELSPAPPSEENKKKKMFLRLSDTPVLLMDRLVSMWLDRETGAKCYMLSARELFIKSSDKREHWKWINLADSRFSESARLRQIRSLEICGRIHSKMLSQGSPYAAYMVFKLANDFYGLDSPVQQSSVNVGGATLLTRKVCLQVYDDSLQQRPMRRLRHAVTHGKDVTLPRKTTGGWMEIELGEFFCEGGEDGYVSFSLAETKEQNWKSGLIVQGIEIRYKESA